MFYSILYPTQEKHEQPRQDVEPIYFKDLGLNLIFEPILMEDKGFGLKKKKSIGLDSFFYTPVRDEETILYRQDVMQELDDEELRSVIVGFINTVDEIDGIVRMVHESLASTIKWHDNYLVRGQLLECTERYCQAISSLSEALSGHNLRSSGLCSFAEFLKEYLASKAFLEMLDEGKKLREELSTVEYCMQIKFPTIRVRKYEGQTDLAKDLLEVFSKFNQGDALAYRHRNPEESQDFRMEATVLNMVAVNYKEIFMKLDNFCDKYYNFDNETIVRFSREVQFYISWLEMIEPMRQNGLPFCYPKLCDTADNLYSQDGFDIGLAFMKRNGRDTIVTNDFEMRSPERIIVVTGPNQGGKTTFARAFGQMHHLAALGLCVPGREAALFLFDNILTHFEREEDLTTMNGKLQDDLVRLRELMDMATSRSIIIINEIFCSTTLTDALSLGKRMISAIAKLDAPAMVVTFLDELATQGPKTVSMMSTIFDDDPDKRTFNIVRKPPDGLAFAIYLARKHGLAYEQVSGRLSK